MRIYINNIYKQQQSKVNNKKNLVKPLNKSSINDIYIYIYLDMYVIIIINNNGKKN